ncbi:MAG TPA: hypothetical protein VH797_06355 [Nitrososphaeraceae archaeon]
MFQKICARTLGFEEIAPKWASRIMTFRQEGFPFPFSLSWWKLYFALDSPSKCIIGEAHGFSSHYEKECAECDRLGWEFGHSFLTRSTTEFDHNIKVLVTHWNNKHIPVKEAE